MPGATGRMDRHEDHGRAQSVDVPRQSDLVTFRACRAPGCKNACVENLYYCGGDFAALLSELTKTIEIIYASAREVYIGRTHYPEQRLFGHRHERSLDHLAVLHW